MLHYCLQALLFSYIIALIFYSISHSGGQLKRPRYHVYDKDSMSRSGGRFKKPRHEVDKEISHHKLPRRPSNYTLRKVCKFTFQLFLCPIVCFLLRDERASKLGKTRQRANIAKSLASYLGLGSQALLHHVVQV